MDPDCPVCYSTLVDPVSLSCGHVLCFPCLLETRSSTANTPCVSIEGLLLYSCLVFKFEVVELKEKMFVSGCPAMSPEQLEMWGPRRSIENIDSPHVTPPPSPHVTPPPSSPVSPQTSPTLSPRLVPPSSTVGSPTRRSTRRGVPNRRFLGFGM